MPLTAQDKQTGPWPGSRAGISVWGGCCENLAAEEGFPRGWGGGGVEANCCWGRAHCPPLGLRKPCTHQVTSPCCAVVVGTSTRGQKGHLCSECRPCGGSGFPAPIPDCGLCPVSSNGHVKCL